MLNQANQYLLAYMTGTFEERMPFENPNEVYFEEFDSQKNNLQHLLDGFYFPFGYTIDGTIQGITNGTDSSQYSLIFGKYKRDDADTYSHSYILIVDKNNVPKHLFKNYSNGDLFGQILGINYGEDGRFFMVEKDTNGYYRFVLMNNILVKSAFADDYEVVMRQTYRIDDQTYLQGINKVEIEKNPSAAKYVILFTKEASTYQVKCIEFTINVGGENEWKYYGGYEYVNGVGNYDYVISWNNNNQFSLNFIMVSPYYSEYGDDKNVELVHATKDFNSDEMSVGMLFPELMSGLDKNVDIWADVKFINETDYYTTIAVDNNYYLYKNHHSPNTPFATILNATYTNFRGIRLFNKNNNIFFTYQNNETYVGVIVNENLYTTEVDDFNANKTLILMQVQNVFDLYLLYIQCGDYVNIAKIPYIDKTNNQPYYKFKSLVPYFGKLYDDNGKLIFVRTLYNKNISGQTTTSTIVVPNLFLNDTTIGGEKLVGKTYLEMIEHDTEVEKNEYEELFVNFANTINIKNENDPNNVILNPVGAARLNKSVSTATPWEYEPDNPEWDGTGEYLGATIFEYRINYEDGTHIDKTLASGEITIEDLNPPYTRRYHLKIFNPKSNPIKSVQLISNDKNTSYHTIKNDNWGLNKYYTITQDVYVV